MNYTTTEVATLFDIAGQTVRKYATEFADYLSPTANPEKGRARQFTDDDLEVYALIVDLKAQNRLYEDIHIALQRGERGDPPLILPSPNGLSPQEQQLAVANARIRDLEAALHRKEGVEEELRRQLAEAQQQLEAARRRLWQLGE